MLVGDLIYSDSFDANCNYAIFTTAAMGNSGAKHPCYSAL